MLLSYVDEDRSTISFVHAFADAKAMDLHIEGAGERSRAAFEFVEPVGWEFYGHPSSEALETIRQAATASRHLDGAAGTPGGLPAPIVGLRPYR